MRNKFEGFVFAQKQRAQSGTSAKDVSITIQKGNHKGEFCYGFAIRNKMGSLILDDKNLIKLGLRGGCLYFIPTNSVDEGFTFSTRNKQGEDNLYSSVRTKNFPALNKFVTTECSFHGMLKYDKELELYYVDLMGGRK